MNYIELINHYWQLREQGIITGGEGDLYMYLIYTSNKLNWKNPFNQSNALICAILNTSEPTLIRHRNTLKQVGLIEFESGKTIKRNTQYYLKNLSSPISSIISSGISSPISSVIKNPLDNNNNKLNQTKLNNNTPLPPKKNYAEFVRMTNAEYQELVAKVGESGANRCIEILDNYKGAHGKRYKSDYKAILNWVIDRFEEEKTKNQHGGKKEDKPAGASKRNYDETF